MINRLLYLNLLAICCWLGRICAYSHPMQNSVLLLDIRSASVEAEFRIPMTELNKTLDGTQPRQELHAYLLAHLQVNNMGVPWRIDITGIDTMEINEGSSYQELIVYERLTPPPGNSPRRFSLFCDLIIHHVPAHKILVFVRHDWARGQSGERPDQVGVIMLDVQKRSVPPVYINLNEGSYWQGFMSMVKLGMEHIREGTDHVLFLLLLLLPAPLLVNNKRWGTFGGVKYAIIRIVKLATAFTIGHSITFITATLGWIRLPSQPVEVCIALTIFITAIHAWRPLLYKKEIGIAGFFGLIHGLAFATVLTDLQLDKIQLALSILGFNAGIELMQLFLILIAMPWLMMLSTSVYYKWLRVTGAVFAMVAATGWAVERVSNRQNYISETVEMVGRQYLWIVAVLICMALIVYLWKKKKKG